MYHDWKMLLIILALFALRYRTVRRNSDRLYVFWMSCWLWLALLHLRYELLLAYFRIWVHQLVSSLDNILFYKTVGQYIEQMLNIAKCFCTCKAISSHKFNYAIHSSWVAKGFPSFSKKSVSIVTPETLLESVCWLVMGKGTFLESYKTATLSNVEATMNISESQTTGPQIFGSPSWLNQRKFLVLMTYFYLLNNEEQIQDLLKKSVFPWRNLDLGFPLNNIKYSYYKTSLLKNWAIFCHHTFPL